jgi:hypothetical protein
MDYSPLSHKPDAFARLTCMYGRMHTCTHGGCKHAQLPDNKLSRAPVLLFSDYKHYITCLLPCIYIRLCDYPQRQLSTTTPWITSPAHRRQAAALIVSLSPSSGDPCCYPASSTPAVVLRRPASSTHRHHVAALVVVRLHQLVMAAYDNTPPLSPFLIKPVNMHVRHARV